MNTKDFIHLGVPLGEATRRATDFVAKFILGGGDKSRLHEEVAAIVANPTAFVEDALCGDFAKALLKAPPTPRPEPVKYRQWGEGLEHAAVMQMERACLLPVAVAGALMPDAHVGHGLPIGGVLATENAVIPYAVGVDIACRMKMTALDLPLRDLERKQDRLTRAIETETRFGVGANFQKRRAHDSALRLYQQASARQLLSHYLFTGTFGVTKISLDPAIRIRRVKHDALPTDLSRPRMPLF